MKPTIEQIIFEAPLHSTMASLARALKMNATTLKYDLGKARRLDLVRRVLFWSNS